MYLQPVQNSFERSWHRPQKCRESETSVGVTPSKELCKCVREGLRRSRCSFLCLLVVQDLYVKPSRQKSAQQKGNPCSGSPFRKALAVQYTCHCAVARSTVRHLSMCCAVNMPFLVLQRKPDAICFAHCAFSRMQCEESLKPFLLSASR